GSQRPGAFLCVRDGLSSPRRRRPMPLCYDHLYLYRGLHGCPSYCWLRISTAPGQTVVLATELEDNPGTSITTIAHRLATEVARTFGLPLDTLRWIEHYPERPGLTESFALVRFTRTAQGLQAPERRRLRREDVETLIGQTLTP